MNRTIFFLLSILMLSGCSYKNQETRVPVAKVGNVTLYYDEIPPLMKRGSPGNDSIGIIQTYINKWAKKELVLQKAEENLTAELKKEIDLQIEETRANLLIYQYQRQMMLEKMDTILKDEELEHYYISNEKSFILTSNIVKALFIKLPVETPVLDKIKTLIRSNDQRDLQQLESLCFQFAEKFDDFNEQWVTMDRLTIELKQDIGYEENFLRQNTFFETNDSAAVFLISIRDYRLRSTLAPFDYIKEDIKRVILNNRRFEYIQNLENGIYNEALKENNFKIY